MYRPKMYNEFKHNRSLYISHFLNKVSAPGMQEGSAPEGIHGVELMKAVPSLSLVFLSCPGHLCPSQPEGERDGEAPVRSFCGPGLSVITSVYIRLARISCHVPTLNHIRVLGILSGQVQEEEEMDVFAQLVVSATCPSMTSSFCSFSLLKILVFKV